MSAPSTPKPAETPVPPEAPEVVEPAAPVPQPPAPPDVESPRYDPFSPIVSAESARVLICLPKRIILNDAPSGKANDAKHTPKQPYSVLILVAVRPKIVPPSEMEPKRNGKTGQVHESTRYAYNPDHLLDSDTYGQNLDWKIALWDPYASTCTSWKLVVDGKTTAVRSDAKDTDPPMDEGGIVCAHITADYSATVKKIGEKAGSRAGRRPFDSEDWASMVIDDTLGDLRGEGHMQSPCGSLSWGADSAEIRQLVRSYVAAVHLYRPVPGEKHHTGIGLLSQEKHVLVDQYYLAMRRHRLPGQLPTNILSFHSDPPKERLLLYKQSDRLPKVSALTEGCSNSQFAVLLVPTLPTTEMVKRGYIAQNEILWSLIIADHKHKIFHEYFNLANQVFHDRVDFQTLEDAPGGIHVAYCRTRDILVVNAVHDAFLDCVSRDKNNSLQWTLEALKAAAKLDGNLLVCPDGRSPLTLEWIMAFSTHLTAALNEQVTFVPEDGVGEIRMTAREAIGSGQGDLFDEHYLHLRRGIWEVLGFGEHADKRIPSRSAQADTSHMPSATPFLPAHMLGPNGHAILYQQPKTTFDTHPLTYTAGHEMPSRWKR